MEISRSPIFFDHADYELLETVNQILEHDHIPSNLNNLLDTRLHPHGIKELGAPQSLRIAVAMMSLLGTMRRGSANDRLFALKAVKTEVLHEGSLSMRHNVARVLMRIMKRIVRTKDNPARQLALIHDFNQAASGKPRLVRKQLKKYFLY